MSLPPNGTSPAKRGSMLSSLRCYSFRLNAAGTWTVAENAVDDMLPVQSLRAQDKTQTVPACSGEATPTLKITTRRVQSGAPEVRQESMRVKVDATVLAVRKLLTDFEKVSERQGYKCPLTGVVDRSMPRPRPTDVATLRCAHILKRAVAVFPPTNSISESENTRVSIYSSGGPTK
jgi:hypothetical protein